MIEGLLLSLLAFGFFVITYDYLKPDYLKEIKKIKGVISSFKEMDFSVDLEKTKPGDKFWEHLRKLLGLTLGFFSDKAVKAFTLISGFLSASSMIILSNKVSTKIQLISMLIFLLLPYFLLRVRLENLRIRSSREGEILITELLNNYRINYFNMREAIEKSANLIEEAPQSKRLLLNLTKKLNRASSGKEIKYVTDDFRLSLNTSWGNILSDSIYLSLVNGTRVDEAISDLSKTIKKARKIDEFSKRENNETKLILRYLVPIAYLFTIVSALTFFDMTIKEFIFYQFQTEVGLTWFTISLITYIVGLIAKSFIVKTKLDF